MKIALLLLWVVLINANVWDNIFSQTQATVPIVIDSSFSFKTTYTETMTKMDIDVTIDYNNDLKVATIQLSKNIIFTNLELLKAQLSLQTMQVNIQQTTQCNKYQLDLLGESKSKISINIGSLSLINLLFRFIGRKQWKRSQYIVYQLDVDQQAVNDKQKEVVIPTLFVLLNDKGRVQHLMKDEKFKEEIPFQLVSEIHEKLQCAGDLQKITQKQMYEIFQVFLTKGKEKLTDGN